MKHPQKITFGEMREMGVHGVLIWCSAGSRPPPGRTVPVGPSASENRRRPPTGRAGPPIPAETPPTAVPAKNLGLIASGTGKTSKPGAPVP
jgi:hypothetical protein